MRRFPRFALSLSATLVVLAMASASPALDILVTNDDGFDSPGIQALRGALIAAGHNVTVVAPLENQSGSGGSLSTDVGAFVDVIEQSPGVWSVDSTPSDAVRAALGAVLSSEPDLVISGLNFGQNLARPGSSGSGTIGAALAAAFQGIPAIAASVGLDFAEANETPIPFPSTFGAFGPAAGFIARLVAALEEHHGQLLPKGTAVLNVNFPVPYDEIEGVKFTRLGFQSNFDLVWQDVAGVIPNGGGPVLINIEFPQSPDGVRKADSDAHRDGFISITPMKTDLTAGTLGRILTRVRLRELTP